MKGKSILKSRTFWLHIAHMAVTNVAPILTTLHVDPATQVGSLIVGAAGIATRFITDKPVSLTGS